MKLDRPKPRHDVTLPAKLLLMTGVEAAAAGIVGKVVEHAGEQLAEERKNVKEELLAAAKDTAYMKDAGNNYAKNIAIRQAIVTKMYEKMAKWFGLANDYYGGDFNKDMAEKLKDVPEENLTAPKPSLAGPAMQHLGYSLEEPDLKEMYLNLLATASDNRRSDDAHPSFVEVIKQLTAEESRLLEDILAYGHPLPIVTYYFRLTGQDGQVTLLKHVLRSINRETNEAVEIPRLAASVDNWTRLGLVEVSYTHSLTAPGSYDWATESPEAKRLAAELLEGQILDFEKGFIRPSDFGRAFSTAVGISSKRT